MNLATSYYAKGPEALVVGLARTGDRDAFAELVNRRQSFIRNFMRRCCHDQDVADDLSRRVFHRAWTNIRRLGEPDKFGELLQRLSIKVLQHHLRGHDARLHAQSDSAELALDVDDALARIQTPARLCVVLFFYAHLSQIEISESTGFPSTTVKTHIRTGTKTLRKLLTDSTDASGVEETA